jgi:tetratricopeptide (TPR) repeat protein
LLLLVARLLLSAALVSVAGAKLYLESPLQDSQKLGWTYPYLTEPKTLIARAFQQMEEGPAQNLYAARSIFKELLVANPASAEQWSELGAVLVKTGQIVRGQYCYMRAGQLAPQSAETDLAIANFHIDVQDPQGALPYLGKILDHTDLYDDTVFIHLDASKLNFDEIVANGGMPGVRPGRSYFRRLLSRGDLENSRRAWAWMKRYSPDNQLADEYVNFLVTKGLPEEARAVWASQLGEADPREGKGQLVSNGGFEKEPSGAFFDWRVSPRAHVAVSRDENIYHSGHASLRIDFDGEENLDYRGVSQRVFLRPGMYRVEAFVRTKGITTDEGVALRVRNAQTEKLIGNSDWKRLETTFAVPAPKVVEIQVVRHSSLRFDSKIAGSVWIDDVSLR